MKKWLICFMTMGVVACGGGGGGGGGSSAPLQDLSATDPVTNNPGGSSGGFSDGNCNYSWAEVMEKGFGCHTGVGGDGSGSGGNSGAGAPPPESRSVVINHYEEFEPNNIFENANIVEFLPVTGDTLQGIEITGSVESASDDSDYFILTPDRSGLYAIYLCDGVCTEQPTDSKVVIRVLDQFGDVLAENPLYEESTKFLTADFDAGLPYYVQVLGFDTGDESYPYRLVIIE
jgi:hypothetical protein